MKYWRILENNAWIHVLISSIALLAFFNDPVHSATEEVQNKIILVLVLLISVSGAWVSRSTEKKRVNTRLAFCLALVFGTMFLYQAMVLVNASRGFLYKAPSVSLMIVPMIMLFLLGDVVFTRILNGRNLMAILLLANIQFAVFSTVLFFEDRPITRRPGKPVVGRKRRGRNPLSRFYIPSRDWIFS